MNNSLRFSFIFIAIFNTCDCIEDEQFTECKRPYSCGSTINPYISYPFWGNDRPSFCGLQGFELTCQDNNFSLIHIDSHDFRVLDINQLDYTMTIARTDWWNTTCPQQFLNTTLNYDPFDPISTNGDLSLFYNCSSSESALNEFTCAIDGTENSDAFYGAVPAAFTMPMCSVSVSVPLLASAFADLWLGKIALQDALKQGFEVEYKIDGKDCDECEKSGGTCGSHNSSLPFICFCSNGSYPVSCRTPGKKNVRLKIGIGFGAAGAGILITCVAFFIYQHCNKKRYASSYLSRNISSDPSSMADVENMSEYFGLNIFTYNELEEATNNFDSSKELGDGGFGTVYYGKLRDGRAVAVKRLYENNYKRVEQFMNEVEILTRLRHQNLVALYGCTSRHSRELLLVYEYIPNGTVADHLHGERVKPGSLPWTIRMSIAIETANALNYLHASDIIHRDVKTNNILLDNNFVVKVADFGLSRLFPNHVTHVSTAPQGTPGYVDPEYHQCYQLTDKSDVYSFGVVLMELISSMPAVDITRHRHEINLSNMALNKIQNDALHELVDPCLGFDSDYNVRKMITAVAELAFRCLQNEKEMRPSMAKVLDTLKDIQSEVYNNVEKAEEVDIRADNAALLKSCPLPQSPDSVTAKWISTSTTPNASG